MLLALLGSTPGQVMRTESLSEGFFDNGNGVGGVGEEGQQWGNKGAIGLSPSRASGSIHSITTFLLRDAGAWTSLLQVFLSKQPGARQEEQRNK